MTTENIIRDAAEILRQHPKLPVGAYNITVIVDEAVVLGEDADADGKADPNSDTGTGDEAGYETLRIYNRPDDPTFTMLLLTLSENDLADLGLGDVDALVNHVVAQLTS